MLAPFTPRAAWAAAAAVLLTACATAPPRRVSSSATERLCIDRRDINMIRALDESHAFVKVRAGWFYMLTVDRKTCAGLALARTIAIVEATTRVCGDGQSLLAFSEPTIGPMRCRIEAIDAVADMNAARDLIESRREQ